MSPSFGAQPNCPFNLALDALYLLSYSDVAEKRESGTIDESATPMAEFDSTEKKKSQKDDVTKPTESETLVTPSFFTLKGNSGV